MCGTYSHGSTREQDFFRNAYVNAPDQCESQKRSQVCNDGTWGALDGDDAYRQSTCRVFRQCAGGIRHGEYTYRTMYQSSYVLAPSQCLAQQQKSRCNDGTWGDFVPVDGTPILFGYSACDRRQCVENTQIQRKMYSVSTVNAPYTCETYAQIQTRTCQNGVWGDWSGDLQQYSWRSCTRITACEVDEQKDRVRYRTDTVNEPDICTMERQESSCTNGVWGAWSGTYEYENCNQMKRCDGSLSGASAEHGTVEEQERYRDDSVMAPRNCELQRQTRRCDNGVWGDWSAQGETIFEQEECIRHTECNEDDERTMFSVATVDAPETCESRREVQTRTCDDGVWMDWSGTSAYIYSTCIRNVECDSDETRTMYLAEFVYPPSTCVSERQYHPCSDGVWGQWTGTYTGTDCTVVTATTDASSNSNGGETTIPGNNGGETTDANSGGETTQASGGGSSSSSGETTISGSNGGETTVVLRLYNFSR